MLNSNFIFGLGALDRVDLDICVAASCAGSARIQLLKLPGFREGGSQSAPAYHGNLLSWVKNLTSFDLWQTQGPCRRKVTFMKLTLGSSA